MFLQLKCRFPGSGGVLHSGGGWVGSPLGGGSPSQGGFSSRGFSIQGVLHLRGDSPSQGGSPFWGFSIWGVLHPRGVSIQGGSPSRGFSIQGGFSIPRGGSQSQGGFSIGGVGGSLSRGFSIQGVLHPGGLSIRGALHLGGSSIPEGGYHVTYPHHAFDVTCMLPPHQLRPTNSAAAYIVLLGHVTPPVNRSTHTCKNKT